MDPPTRRPGSTLASRLCARGGRRAGIDQKIGGYSQPRPDSTDHVDGELSLARQDFGNAGAAANHRLEIAASKALLFHAELYRHNRIRRVHRMMLCLPGIDERGQYIEFVARRRSRGRPHQLRDSGYGGIMVFFSSDWTNPYIVPCHI